MKESNSMNPSLIKYLCCTRCQHGELFDNGQGKIICPNCNIEFPIVNKVPDFSETEGKHVDFEYQWNKRQGGEFEEKTLYGKSEQDEYDQFFQYLNLNRNDIKGKKILDAGCGSGRLLSLLIRDKDVNAFGIDMSPTICELRKQYPDDNLHLIRGSLLCPPINKSLFDYVWSGGVIHHTGNTELAFKNLTLLVKPGGCLYVWVYSVDQKIFGKIRTAFPFLHEFPPHLLHQICKMLAIPIYLGGIITNNSHPYKEIVFKLFDHLHPKYRTVHSEKEVHNWFESAGFNNIKVMVNQRTGGVGMFGVKNRLFH